MGRKKKFSNKRIGSVQNYRVNDSFFKNILSLVVILRVVIIVACISLVIFFGKYLIYAAQSTLGIITNSTIQTISQSLGKKMQKDAFGNINILLVGHGGAQHAGGYLADSIIVVSRNPEHKAMTMVSVPRDLYVSIASPRIRGKINSVFAAAFYRAKDFGDEQDKEKIANMRLDYASQILAEQLEKITGLEIPYYAIVDFEHFKTMIDNIGGITVNVPEFLYDMKYPEGKKYSVFSIAAGKQILDGETALKYARSRHSTSDFSRSARQQQIIKAVISKILTKENLSSVSKVKKLYKDYAAMVHTNISNKEMIGMIQYKDAIKHIFTFNFSTECVYKDYKKMPPACFLHYPSRDGFNGASVILPNGSSAINPGFYEYTQNFIFFAAHHQGYLIEAPRIGLYNGIEKELARKIRKKAGGHAGNMSVKLVKYGFNIVDLGNKDEQYYTTILISGTGNYDTTIKMLNDYFLPIDEVLTGQILDSGIDLALILGSSYLEHMGDKKFSYDKLQ